MHLLLHLLAQSTPSTTSKTSKSSGSSVAPLIIIVGIFAVAYFLFLRPRQQRLRQQQTAAKQLSVGDEVMSAGGIHGRVVALDNDVVEVEVAPGVVMTFTRRAISPRPPTASSNNPAPPPASNEAPWQDDSPPSPKPSSFGSGEGPAAGPSVPPSPSPGN